MGCVKGFSSPSSRTTVSLLEDRFCLCRRKCANLFGDLSRHDQLVQLQAPSFSRDLKAPRVQKKNAVVLRCLKDNLLRRDALRRLFSSMYLSLSVSPSLCLCLFLSLSLSLRLSLSTPLSYSPSPFLCLGIGTLLPGCQWGLNDAIILSGHFEVHPTIEGGAKSRQQGSNLPVAFLLQDKTTQI